MEDEKVVAKPKTIRDYLRSMLGIKKPDKQTTQVMGVRG